MVDIILLLVVVFFFFYNVIMLTFGERTTKLSVIFFVIAGVYILTVSALRFGRFLASVPSNNLPYDCRTICFRIIVNWTLASCYLYLHPLVECIVQKIGNLFGLPGCYFKFTKIVLLLSILNGIIILWQAIPEICIWRFNFNHVDKIHFYLHCSMWVIFFMIMCAIDITEITGIKSIFYYNLTNSNLPLLKSQQFNRFLSNMGYPGSSCFIILLWAQKVMSFDRLLLAVIWTSGILLCNQTDNKDIKYVAKQLERKKLWMYYSERITVTPLN